MIIYFKYNAPLIDIFTDTSAHLAEETNDAR